LGAQKVSISFTKRFTNRSFATLYPWMPSECHLIGGSTKQVGPNLIKGFSAGRGRFLGREGL
jgi:hypothetical protein